MTDREFKKLFKESLIERLFPLFSWQHKLKDKITSFFNPRQKWLTKTIPNTWCDKSELIRDILFECLVNYVEDEDGISFDYDWSKEVEDNFVSQAFADAKLETHNALKNAYYYIKVLRVIDHEKLDELTDDNLWEEAIDLEYRIEEKDTEVCLTIVKHHGSMWT